MITNVAGGNGNDLCFDDLLVEKCDGAISGYSSSDTTTCAIHPITLDAGPGYLSYLWNDASINQTISIAPPLNTPDTVISYVNVTDTNGCIYSDTTFIYFDICTSFENKFSFQKNNVYPNPYLGSFNIDVQNPNCFIEIYNSIGELVQAQKLAYPSTKLQINQLNSSIYYYTIKENNAIISSGKIINGLHK